MNNNIVTGVDIGGSHITVALIDLQTHAIIRESLVRRHINSKSSADVIIQEWAHAIVLCKGRHPQPSNKLGIAIPGPFDYNKGISFITGLDKYEALYKLDVKELLAMALHITVDEIYMMNDASCFLKGEIFGGAASGSNNVIGITLGTGLGSAISVNGFIHDGELFCAPYKDSTAEDYLSTRWFIKAYKDRTGTDARNVKELRDRVKNDEVAASLFNEFGKI